jgi:hypothetical protein
MEEGKDSPIRFPENYNSDQSEQKIKLLLEGNNLQAQIDGSKSEARNSMRWGVFVIVIALLTIIGLAIVSKRDAHTISITTESFCCNGKIVQSSGCCPLYDFAIYGFIFLSLVGLAIGWILMQHYVAASKKVMEINDQRQTLAELQAAWEMTKGLADWAEQEPETIIQEKKKSYSKPEESRVAEIIEEKTTTKGKEYSFHRQRAQQQIIETLLSRISK